jgi:hypothetical protein
MTRKSIRVDHTPEQPIVYLVTSNRVTSECIAEVYTYKHAALERAGEMVGWVVHTIDLEDDLCPST